MEKQLADALLNFYQQILKPEFDALKEKNLEHDRMFSEILGHLDALYHRVGRLEDEVLAINSRLKRIEDHIAAGNARQADLEKQVLQIKEQIVDLQTRLEAVERKLAEAPRELDPEIRAMLENND